MKNINLIKVIGVVALLAVMSCKESFLDVKPGDSVPFATAIKTEAEMQGAVNGMYAALRSANLYGRTIPLLGDLMADNVYVSASNSNRYITHGAYTVNSLNGDVSGLWINGYNAIIIHTCTRLLGDSRAPAPHRTATRSGWPGDRISLCRRRRAAIPGPIRETGPASPPHR